MVAVDKATAVTHVRQGAGALWKAEIKRLQAALAISATKNDIERERLKRLRGAGSPAST